MSTSKEIPTPAMAGQADPVEMIDKNKFIAAMNIDKSSDEALREAFNVLSSRGHVSSDVIRHAMSILGVDVQADEIAEIIQEKGKVENDEMIDSQTFATIMKNIWKSVAGSMINDVEKVIVEFIQNNSKVKNIRREFINNLEGIGKQVVDQMIPIVEKEIDAFISKKAYKQENDGNTRKEIINSLEGIEKQVVDHMIPETEKETGEFSSKKVEQENDANICKEFINSMKGIGKWMIDEMIHGVKEEIKEFISKEDKSEDAEITRRKFIKNMKGIGKLVVDEIINEVENYICKFISMKAENENYRKWRTEFINKMKGIRKQVFDVMIPKVEKNIDDFISKNAGHDNYGNARTEFIDNMKAVGTEAVCQMFLTGKTEIDMFMSNKVVQESDTNTYKVFKNEMKEHVANQVIHEVEKEVEKFILEKVKQKNDRNTREEFIIIMRKNWERVANSMISGWKKEIDEFFPDMAEVNENICKEFINRMKSLGEMVFDRMINEVEKEIDQFIWNTTELKNYGDIHSEFINSLKDHQKMVDGSTIKEQFCLEEVPMMAHVMLLAKRLGSNVSTTLLRHLLPFLGGNLTYTEIIHNIKEVKDNLNNDGQINHQEFNQIIRNIWQKSADLLSKEVEKAGQSSQQQYPNGLDPSEAPPAFKLLCDPLDDSVSATLLRAVMLNLNPNPDFEELYWKIYYVKANSTDELIKVEQFNQIIKNAEYLIEKYPLNKIYGVLTEDQTRKLVLSGESGVGKTWMATKIADRATWRKRFDFALWVNLKGLNLHKIIAHQLSLLSASDEMETVTVKEVLGGDKKKSKSLEQRILSALHGKRVLFIFDGVNSSGELDEYFSEKSKLHTLLNLNEPSCKVLITTSSLKKFEQEYKQGAIRIEVRRWTNHESESFLRNSIGDGKFSEVRDLATFYTERSKGLPAEILIIAKTLNYFVNSYEGRKKLQGVKEVVLEVAAHDYYDYRNIENLFISTEVVPKNILVDCYSSETPAKHFLNERGSVHYNELICYWILEGHLGHFSCIEDAYAEGHRVLMELLDCGLLKPLKAGYVKSNGAKFEFSAQDYLDLYQNKRLGLATTFDNKLGNTVLGDGMIRTYPSDKEKDKRKEEEKKEKMSTLLLDGNRTGEVSDNLFDYMEDLEIFAIFDPTHKPFPLCLSDRKNLRLLVLRGCEFMTRFDQAFGAAIQNHPGKPPRRSLPLSASLPECNFSNLSCIPVALSELIVLEISGPSFLKEIPENLFDTMENLKSLNMSSLQMKHLPASFYKLTTIEILILKDCSSLKKMESLKNFKKLQLLNLSGATSLEAFTDKSFSKNKKLQMIDLSQSRIAKFPVVRSLRKLQYLSLRKCPVLIRVRKIGSVETLRVFDISGSKKVDELLDPGLQKLQNLSALNVSGTAIRRVPSTIGTPRYLHLSDCSNLKQLPPIKTLSEVRVLDLSGSALLDDIKPAFITSLKNLVEFNLSNTGVVHLPPLSSLVNLRRLLMSQCQRLESLEGLGPLTNLEVLDLSGCKALSKIDDQSFDKMDRLVSLDLSETPFKKLPSLSKLKKLKKLNLRGCTELINTPGLEDLPVLEDLDVSRTTLKVPELKNPNCRRHGPKPSSYKEFIPKDIREDLGFQKQEQASGETKVELEPHQLESEEAKVDCDDKTKLTQEEIYQCDHWSIWNSLASETIGKPVIDAHFVRLMKLYPKLLDEIKKFHFIVYPMEEAAQQFTDEEYLCRNEIVLRKILHGDVFPEAQEQCLEIRGFRDIPKFLGQLLKHAEMIVLIDNSCLQFLSDLGADNLEKMKVCWMERCNEMEYITDEESADILTENMEILWVSEAAKLKSICEETSRGIGFSALTSLYLEYCQELSSLCFSYEQLVGLKILHVKYCPKLVNLFGDESTQLPSAQLPNLESLHLWALPALKEISCSMHSLRTLNVAHCPLLEYIFYSDTFLPTNRESLQLQVKFCEGMKNILRGGHLPSDLPGEHVIVLGCPYLTEPQIPESSAPRNP